MATTWVISTGGEVLRTMRRFLRHVWRAARLEGMLVPYYQDSTTVQPRLIDDPGFLVLADPCVPFVPVNSAKLLVELAHRRPDARLALVLRGCELRAWQRLCERGAGQPEPWLIIGVDCMASFSDDDWGWRVIKAKLTERITRENLQHARHAGIAPYRYRAACQMCLAPQACEADICLWLFGLRTRENILVNVKEAELSERLQLSRVTSGPAPEWLLREHASMVKMLQERRGRTRRSAIASLPAEMPGEVGAFIRQLQNCVPCRACLNACPLYNDELNQYAGDEAGLHTAVRQWLANCAACGMCEQACPQHLPLTAIIGRINQGQAPVPVA